jgi:flavin reductase (DIM6/NTAB) family NADH-FMN oxidoreductase RutF
MSLRKKPWNRVNLPVYSISSTDGKGNHNMHIITYATAISMQPKLFSLGIYHGTKTLKLVEEYPEFVLQLLSAEQFRLVNLLGKQSGNKINKIQRLQKRKLIEQWNGFYILSDALAVMHMKIQSKFDGGDHQGVVCEVIGYKNMNEGHPLTLDVLRDKQIIRS